MTHTVLLLEDEEELRETMRDALEYNGYDVIAVSDGQAALERLAGIDNVCVVLLDLIMPRMNGWDFFAKLRAMPTFAATPVIVHSSVPANAPAGATRVLGKPIKLAQLLSVVQEFCAPT